MPAAEQVRALGGVHPVALVALPGGAAAVADDHARHPWREEIVQPLRLRAFLEDDVDRVEHAGDELQPRRLLVGRMLWAMILTLDCLTVASVVA